MRRDMLDPLKSEDFELSLPVVSLPAVLRRALQDREEVDMLGAALASGAVTDEDLRSFTRELMESFEGGKTFAYDIALAAIAVALEPHRAPIADEILRGLADLQVAEMRTSTHVARLCLEQRRAEPIAVDTGLVTAFTGRPRQLRLRGDFAERIAA
jgi:hypothetical protein